MNARGVFSRMKKMPVKPPRGGSSHVDASGSLHRSTDADTSLQRKSGRIGGESNLAEDISQPRAGSSSDTTIDGLLPSAAVVVHAIPAGARPPEPQSSLDYYVTNARAILPQVNSDGLRVIGKRMYADLANGDLVPVATDPVTGLYRARRPSELLASGPVLLRNPDTGYWYPRAVVEPTTLVQIRKYLPEINEQAADAFTARFDNKDEAELELKHIQLGLPQLDSKHVSIPQHQNHVVQSHEVTEAFAMWDTLRQVYKWQGEPDQQVYSNGRLSGYKLDINLTLWPVDRLLSLKFKSVVSLTLRGHAPLDPQVFFAQFPNIESLTVTSQLITRRTFEVPMYASDYSRFSMDSRFAEQLKRLAHLRELSLQDCEFKTDFLLRGLTRLRVLRLCNTHEVPVNDLYLQMRHQQQADILQVAVDLTGMTQLRVLDLTNTGIQLLPSGIDANDVASKLEVLRLGGNRLSASPSLKNMTALQELDLSSSRLDRFPEGITDRIPGKVLNLANSRIASIPESVELRAGFNLNGNPINDPSSLRRLIHARINTGSDIWLAEANTDRSATLWLRNVPEAEAAEKTRLWDSFEGPWSTMLNGIRTLSRTPEFHVERPLLQRRVWRVLENFSQADAVERAWLSTIVEFEPSPGKMLDWLEAEIRKYDGGRQYPPLHHRPKRPRLE
jgi:hypothetical protein